MKPNLSIYVVAHKPFPRKLVKDGYCSIGVGKHRNTIGCDIADDQGDNIAEKNDSFCELTAQYWIWKNSQADIVGLVHYRRFFFRPLLSIFRRHVYTRRFIKNKLKRFDVILPKPMLMSDVGFSSVREHYDKEHYSKDILTIRQIISEKHPDYLDAFDQIMNGEHLRLYNMLIAKKEIYDQYSAFLFDILFEAERRIDIHDYDAYQKRIFGFIGERLVNVYFLKHSELKVYDGSVWLNDGTSAWSDFWARVNRSLKKR